MSNPCLVAATAIALMSTPARADGEVIITYHIPQEGDGYAQADAQFWVDMLDSSGYLDQVVQAFEGLVSPLSEDFVVVVTTCGEPNAYYFPGKRLVHVCYELLDEALVLSAPYATSASDAVGRALAVGAGVLGHELGHAMVDLLEIPTLGRREDAADALGVYLLVAADMRGVQVADSIFWRLLAEAGEASNPRGVHSPAMVRYYNTLCLVYGSDPDEWGWLEVILGPRARSCRGEWADVARVVASV